MNTEQLAALISLLHVPLAGAYKAQKSGHCLSRDKGYFYRIENGLVPRGVDRVYTAENKQVMQYIIELGTVISVFPFVTKSEGGNFPQRNRIIGGLSHGTIIVEAGHRSGAILTAFNAIDQNREVFAVSGRIADERRAKVQIV